MSAEAAFFALLALPPMLLALAAAAGYVGDLFGPGVRRSVQQEVLSGLGTFLSPRAMSETVGPAIERLFARGRAEIVSLAAITALWSAAKMTGVLIEAVGAAYGVPDPRPAWRRRLVAVAVTAAGIAALAVVLPLLVVGPELGAFVSERVGLAEELAPAWRVVSWPLSAAIAVVLLTSLYHVAPGRRAPWRRGLPGALFATAVWVAAAFGLRAFVGAAISEGTFGPLAAPAVLLVWLYVTAASVLAGAELGAAMAGREPAVRPATIPAARPA